VRNTGKFFLGIYLVHVYEFIPDQSGRFAFAGILSNFQLDVTVRVRYPIIVYDNGLDMKTPKSGARIESRIIGLTVALRVVPRGEFAVDFAEC
jgi:hypothetical protein